MPRVGEPVMPVQFSTEMYVFIGVSAAEYKEVGYHDFPPLVVKYLDFESLRSSVGGVEEYLKRKYKGKPAPHGYIARVSLTALRVSKWVK